MSDEELLTLLDRLRSIMVAVSTGGPRIDEVNQSFQIDHRRLVEELANRNIENTLSYTDLWQWYGRWSTDLPSYASRRTYVANLFEPLRQQIVSRRRSEVLPTGWALVDRQVGAARQHLAAASVEEEFQGVGLLCREAMISLAQEVFDASRHPTEPGINVSATDFKRMIEAYIAVELRGSAADEARRHARTALDLAVRLQHLRTATFKDAAICMEATASVANIIAILSGQRDP